ncbi:hypothetical protein [Streptomyces sp. NPDC093105]|uniref:hypothetical protein n=1 Tax=Streptomyces sp. NPDC093105 TaxID=3366029 RepID=UPI003824F46E
MTVFPRHPAAAGEDGGPPAVVLPVGVRDQIVGLLRAGHRPEEAAAGAGLRLQTLEAAAVGDGVLAVALTGRDPFTREAGAVRQRAELLRCVALGMTLAAAARAAGVPESTLGLWRTEDEPFRDALDGARALAEASRGAPRSRLSPAAIRLFLQSLREGRPVTAAAERAGVSTSTVYARRHRDPAFAASMDTAREEGARTRTRARFARLPPPRRWEGRYRLVRQAPGAGPTEPEGDPPAAPGGPAG